MNNEERQTMMNNQREYKTNRYPEVIIFDTKTTTVITRVATGSKVQEVGEVVLGPTNGYYLPVCLALQGGTRSLGYY
jgi:hypothetical protein